MVLANTICLHNLGDSAPNSSQVSPGSYRAAVLKNRFADTIFKAREKTLNQVGYKMLFADVEVAFWPVYA